MLAGHLIYGTALAIMVGSRVRQTADVADDEALD